MSTALVTREITPADANRGRQRAQRMFEAKQCSACGKTETLERHHVDGNPLNNAPANIRVLCTRCHMVEDGRLAASTERLRTNGRRAPVVYKGTICTVNGCDRPAKYKALCNTHYYRARSNGGAAGPAEIRPYKRSV